VFPVAQISCCTRALSVVVPGFPHGLPSTLALWIFAGEEVSLPGAAWLP
jgi:hypothetical protein